MVLGGRAHGRPSGSVEVWPGSSKRWEALAPLQLRRPRVWGWRGGRNSVFFGFVLILEVVEIVGIW